MGRLSAEADLTKLTFVNMSLDKSLFVGGKMRQATIEPFGPKFLEKGIWREARCPFLIAMVPKEGLEPSRVPLNSSHDFDLMVRVLHMGMFT